MIQQLHNSKYYKLMCSIAWMPIELNFTVFTPAETKIICDKNVRAWVYGMDLTLLQFFFFAE